MELTSLYVSSRHGLYFVGEGSTVGDPLGVCGLFFCLTVHPILLSTFSLITPFLWTRYRFVDLFPPCLQTLTSFVEPELNRLSVQCSQMCSYLRVPVQSRGVPCVLMARPLVGRPKASVVWLAIKYLFCNWRFYTFFKFLVL